MSGGLLDSLGVDERRKLLAACRRRRFASREVVFHEGDPGDSLHLIERGRFAVRSSTPLGDVATLELLGAGAFFGELALLDPEARRNATVVAMEPGETLSLKRAAFAQLRGADRSVDNLLLDVLATRVRLLSASLLEALYLPAETRVLRQLLGAAELWGGCAAGEVVPLTQDDLAGLAGTTRPTVNRVLGDAAAAGLVLLGRGRIELIHPEGLKRKAGLR